MRLVNWRTLVVAAAGVALAACGDDVTVTPTPISFTTNPAAVSCVAGTTTAVGLSVAGGTGTPTVTFQASGSGFTVTQSGNSATIACTAAGAGAVNFTITSGGQTVTGSIPVTVSAAPAPVSPVTAVIVNPTALTLVPGGSGQLTATVTLATGAPAGTSTNVTWSTSDATVATVDANGRVTALAAAAGRTAVITATSVANTNLRASAAVTVGAASTLVTSLSASPSAVTLTTGQTQQITSNVTLAAGAPAGTSTGVTYTSSDTTIARVSSTGVITAGRAGTATITIASVAAPTVTQTVAVTVAAQAPVRLTIQGLRVVNAAGNAVPADPTNIAGNLFATLNLDPGSFTPDSVVATLGTQRIVCQRFSAQLAQALKSSLNDGSADVQPIECAINTAQFNPTTGVASVQNGQAQLSATVFYRPSAGAPASESQTATINQALTLNNTSGYFVNVTNTPTAAQIANGAPANGQATGPQGVLWRAGSVTVTAVPVNFGAPAQGTGTQDLTVSLQDINAGQLATKTVTAATGSSFTVTFSGASAPLTPIPNNVNPGCQCLDGYTSPNAGAAPLGTAGGTAGTQVVIGGGVNSVFLNSNGVPQASGPVIYIDNTVPEARDQFVGANFLLGGAGSSGFLNGTFNFSSVQQAAAGTVLGDFNGVDRVSRTFFFANAAQSLTPAQIVAAAQPAANASGTIIIPTNTTPNQYALAANLADALGNAVPVQVNGLAAVAGGSQFFFGVSTAAPTAAFAGTAGGTNVGSNARIGATVTTPRTIAVTVTSPVGFSATPLQGTLSVVTPTGTFCAVAADIVGNVLTGVSTQTTGTCPTLNFTSVAIDPTTAQQGIYTLSVVARDVAGNVSGTLTRTFVIDRVAPVVTNAVPVTVPIRGGAPATFAATASDNLSLVTSLAIENFAAPTEINLRYDGTTLGQALATPFTRNANVSVTIPSFIRAIALQPGVTAQNTQVFTTVTGVAVGATDAGNNGGFNVISGTAINALLDQTQLPTPQFFGLPNGPASVSVLYTPNNTTTASAAAALNLFGGAGAVTTPTAVTITVRQNGNANTPFTSPFARIEVYQRATIPGTAVAGALPFATTTAYQLLGTLATGGLTVSPTASTINSTFTFTPSAFPTAGTTAVDLLVLATDANGYSAAIVLPTITLNP